MNIIDQAIRIIAPGWALKRSRARNALAYHQGWAGASRFRPALANWNPSGTDADADLIWDLPTLRARSQDAYRNSPLAGAAVNSAVMHVIGSGLSLQCAPNAPMLQWSEDQTSEWKAKVHQRWAMWAEKEVVDVTRHNDFYGLQELAFRSMLLSGDVFALLTGVSDAGVFLPTVQLIEADRVSNPNGEMDSTELISGVRIEQSGRPKAYCIASVHPGSRLALSTTTTWIEIPATSPSGRRNVVHLFARLRPGQTRGVPFLAPVIESLKQLQRYTEAELQAAVVSGVFAAFVRMDHEAFQDLFPGDSEDTASRDEYIERAKKWDGSIPMGSLSGPGRAVNLLPGEAVDSPTPGRPNSEFNPFVEAIIRQIGARLGIPFEVLVKHFTSSYSASRAALLDAWRTFRVMRETMASQFCQPIFEHWLEWEIANGDISAPGFFSDPNLRSAYTSATWIGDGPGSIDPEKEVRAAERRVGLGISTLAAESILYDGGDWETKHAQRVREVAMRREAGLEDQPTTSNLASPPDPGLPEP